MQQPAVQFAGELSLSAGGYAVRGLETDHAQLTPCNLSGVLMLIAPSGWRIPLQIVGSSQRSQGPQAYNQISISPQYKDWLTLHGGYRSLIFSPFTLAGQSVVGIGVELNPGLFRFGYIVGRFGKAVYASDTDLNRLASFRRTGYSAKVGVGNTENYIDLILLRAADDGSSARPDSWGQLTPAENTVLGLSGRIRLYKKLLITLDAASSAYTTDTHSFSTSAFASSQSGCWKGINWLEKFVAVRPSTDFRTALQTSLGYKGKWGDLKLRYKRIEPGYKSMGVYSVQQDIESMTVVPSLRLFKKRLNVQVSAGWQHDNLCNQKKIRLNRMIGSFSASYVSDSDLTLDLTVSNHGITQRAGFRPLNDTIRVAQNNRTISGSVFKSWTGPTQVHTVTGLATCQELQDLNSFTAETNQYKNWSYSLTYSFQHLPTGLNVTAGYSYTHTRMQAITSMFYGTLVSIDQKVGKNDKLEISLAVSYLKSLEQITDYTQVDLLLNTSFSINYQLSTQHRLSVSANTMLNRGPQPIREQQGTVQYVLSF
ncbi:hypothetical protein GCM10027577_27860 [Spirosoma fluminis]